MPNPSIYQRQSPEIAQLFDQVAPKKILIVPIDFANEKHLALCCNGNGDQLLKPFTVHNNQAGLDFLLERIKTTCQRHGIDPKHVMIGGEDCPPYALNLLWALHRQTDALVVRVNAWKAKRQRENLQASNDRLDLLGIAKTMINRDAYMVFHEDSDLQQEIKHYDAMREIGRSRDALVKTKTAISNRIHKVVKVLFPGFLEESGKNPVSPFTLTSLALMDRADFHSAAYAKKSPASLAKLLGRYRITDPAQSAIDLIERAKAVLPCAPHAIAYHQKCLRALVATYRKIDSLDKELEHQEAIHLAHTPAAFLTSRQGIGILTAAAIAGEQGHSDLLGPLRHMSSYAGIVPGIEQSGGEDKPARTTKVKPRCNRRLKNHLVGAINRMGNRVGRSEFRDQYNRLNANGQHADFILARRFLLTAKAIMTNRTIYLPQHLRGRRFTRDSLFEYLQVEWPKMRLKWRQAKALDQAFREDAPLGIWRKTIEEVYLIDLPLENKPVTLKGGELPPIAAAL